MSKKVIVVIGVTATLLVVGILGFSLYQGMSQTSPAVTPGKIVASSTPAPKSGANTTQRENTVTTLTTLPGVTVTGTKESDIACSAESVKQKIYTLSGLSYDAAFSKASAIVKDDKTINLVQDSGAAVPDAKMINLIFADGSAVLFNFPNTGEATLTSIEGCK